jgi:hypothetical protein
MKFLKNPIFWREKILTFNMGAASIIALFLQFIPPYSITLASSKNIIDFFSVFGVCWFSCITFGQIGSFRTEDIEAIMATPLGIKNFLKGRALFSTTKFFIYSGIITLIIYSSRLEAIFACKLFSLVLFFIYPFLLYNWALFINIIGLLVPDRFMAFLALVLISPPLFISSFLNIIFSGTIKDLEIRHILEISILPIMGIIALTFNYIFFKFISKEAIRSECLKN